MASFPGAKVHRVSRRKLGRGQSTQFPAATVTPVAATAVVTCTFSQPVVYSGGPLLSLSGSHVLLTAVQTTPTVVVLTFSATVVGATWTVVEPSPARTMQGGGVAPATGTF